MKKTGNGKDIYFNKLASDSFLTKIKTVQITEAFNSFSLQKELGVVASKIKKWQGQVKATVSGIMDEKPAAKNEFPVINENITYSTFITNYKIGLKIAQRENHSC